MPSSFRCSSAAILACAAALCAGCGDDGNQDADGARALLARVQADGYRSWDRAPGWEERRASSGAHAKAVDIFVNDRVAEALATQPERAALPAGSVIVKDGYDGDDFRLTAIMEKRNDGWYWAEYSAAGDPSFSGHPNVCLNCHRTGNDFVRAF